MSTVYWCLVLHKGKSYKKVKAGFYNGDMDIGNRRETTSTFTEYLQNVHRKL